MLLVSASGRREELCMNHPNGLHSERNDPSLSAVCWCLWKCTGGQELLLASSLAFLAASAQRGPLEGPALLGDFSQLTGM